MNFDELFQIIDDRKNNPQPGSYTWKLMEQGEDAILQKVGEEAMEVILAAKGQGNQRVIEEVSDLFFHALVLLSSRGLGLNDVYTELEERHRKKTQP